MKTVKVIDEIKWMPDFPIMEEAYRVGRVEDGRYFFAWGPEYPYMDELPSIEILDGESGLRYYETAQKALNEMDNAIAALGQY